MGILQGEPNMKVRTIIRTVEALYGGYVITYGKAWRAKQRAWKIYMGTRRMVMSSCQYFLMQSKR